MSARQLFIVFQIFEKLLVWRSRHSSVSPNAVTECADSAENRDYGTKQKPNCHRHVLRRFAIFSAVAKRTSARLLCRKQDRHHADEEKLFHAMRRSRFIFR